MANLVLNPSFETITSAGPPVDFANWSEIRSAGNLVEDEQTLTHSGSHALKLTRTTNSVNVNQTITGITGGAVYTLSFWTRGDGVHPGYYYLQDVTHATYIKLNESTGIAGTAYALYSYTFTAPAGCTSLRIFLYSSGVNSSYAYFDDVSLTLAGRAAVHTIYHNGAPFGGHAA